VRQPAFVAIALVVAVACGGTPGTSASTAAEPAPDFTLDLGQGGSYTLSEGAKPVYLVFWAEW
jgi:hypothetical protein